MAKRLAKTSETIEVHGDGTLRLVAVADTHSSPHEAAARTIAALAPDAILHAGDIGDLSVLDVLRSIAPVYAVRGNIDSHAGALPDVLTLEVRGADGAGLRVLVLHIGVAGPRLRADAARLARDAGASLVVCGHSHVPFIGREGAVTVFNPGSVGPKRFHLPIVFGVIEVSPRGVTLRHVDAATGARWEP